MTNGPLGASGEPDASLGRDIDVGGFQRQPAAIGHGVAGVDDDVHDRLLHLHRIDADLPQVALRSGSTAGS